MCACSDKVEGISFDLVDEKPVPFDMAFAVTGPFPMQCVVAIGCWKVFFIGKHRNDSIQFYKILAPTLDPFVVVLECT